MEEVAQNCKFLLTLVTGEVGTAGRSSSFPASSTSFLPWTTRLGHLERTRAARARQKIWSACWGGHAPPFSLPHSNPTLLDKREIRMIIITLITFRC